MPEGKHQFAGSRLPFGQNGGGVTVGGHRQQCQVRFGVTRQDAGFVRSAIVQGHLERPAACDHVIAGQYQSLPHQNPGSCPTPAVLHDGQHRADTHEQFLQGRIEQGREVHFRAPIFTLMV